MVCILVVYLYIAGYYLLTNGVIISSVPVFLVCQLPSIIKKNLKKKSFIAAAVSTNSFCYCTELQNFKSFLKTI